MRGRREPVGKVGGASRESGSGPEGKVGEGGGDGGGSAIWGHKQ